MKLNFLEDKEINLEKDDLIGTRPYVNTLLEIIKNSGTPFTIGLFGSWGTGKSSIIETLKKILNEDYKSNILVFKYDAWKYSRDSFRRTFILNLKTEFNILGTAKLNSFYQEESKDQEIKSFFNFKYCLYVFLFSIFTILPILAIAKHFNLFRKLELTVPIIISFIALFISFFKNVFTDLKFSIKNPIIFAPEQFEDAFKEIVCKIVNDKCSNEYISEIKGINKFINKIVIVIDNIDRCHKDNAFELLLTIKSFLEQERVIFIIPIDEFELKKHIEANGHNGNEFLRKLFNTTVTIKMFSERDLFDFAQKLNVNHNLNLSGEVISLISQEFSKNPRKIIQFLNVLQTEIILAEELEINENIPKGSITGNLPFLTKLLIIREEWDTVYRALRENPYWFNDIDMQLKEDSNKIKFGDIDLSDEQRNFFSRTKHISSNIIEVFFTNKDSFLNIPDEVNKLVESQDWKGIKKLLELKTLSFDNLVIFFKTKFDTDIKNRKLINTTGVNLFSLIFKIATDIDYADIFSKFFYSKHTHLGEIKTCLNSDKISKIILIFDPLLLLNFVKTNLQQNDILLQEIINVINSIDHGTNDLLNKFIESFKENPSILEKINAKFSEILSKEPGLYKSFKDIVSDDIVFKSLINTEAIKYIINQINPNPNEDKTELKMEIINNFHLHVGFTKELVNLYIGKILSLLKSTDPLLILSFWFKNLKDYINEVESDSLKTSIFEILNQKNTFLWQQYNSSWNNKEYQQTIQYFFEAATEYYFLSKGTKNEIITWLNTYFNRNESSIIFLHINMLFKKIIDRYMAYNWPFSQQVIDKFNQLRDLESKKEIANTVNLMLTKTSDEKGLNKIQIQDILKKYLDDLDNTKEWITNLIKNPVIKNQLKETIKKYPTANKKNFLGFINKIDTDLTKETIEEVFNNTKCNELESTYQTFQEAKLNPKLIKNSIKNILIKLQKENNTENIKCILKFVLKNELLESNIILEIIKIITPFLSNFQEPKENKIFAMQILKEIDIPKKDKGLIKELLKKIDEKDFNDDEKILLKQLKKKK